MDVVVDGSPNFKVEGDPSDVFSVLVAVNEFLHKQGRGIVSVRADEADIPPARLIDSLQDTPTNEVMRLEVTSEKVSTLVEAYLKEMDEVLPELPKASHELAEVFQGEAPEEGYEPFQTFSRNLARSQVASDTRGKRTRTENRFVGG